MADSAVTLPLNADGRKETAIAWERTLSAGGVGTGIGCTFGTFFLSSSPTSAVM
jgi:hypothetical protein